MNYRWSGIISALAAAALFGASTPVAKQLLPKVDPRLMAGLLYLLNPTPTGTVTNRSSTSTRTTRICTIATNSEVPDL